MLTLQRILKNERVQAAGVAAGRGLSGADAGADVDVDVDVDAVAGS